MKLRIEEKFWGINHRTGSRSERVTADETFACEIGELPAFGSQGKYFVIDEVYENRIVLSIHYYNNPSASKKWEIKVGKSVSYMPWSFDGGYKYRFFVTK